jgi:hypothetical protein
MKVKHKFISTIPDSRDPRVVNTRDWNAEHAITDPESLNVKDYGAKGNGTTDDTAAIQEALNAAAVVGGSCSTVYFPPGIYKITSALIIPGNITLQGNLPSWKPGFEDAELHSSTWLLSWMNFSVLSLDVSSGATLTLTNWVSYNVAIKNLIIKNHAVGFQEVDDSNFSGTAISNSGTTPSITGITINDVCLLGFEYGIDIHNCGRMSIERVSGDCNTGLKIDFVPDMGTINDIHIWPALSSYHWAHPEYHHRTGSGIILTDYGGTITNAFVFDHDVCFDIYDATEETVCQTTGMVMHNCRGDGPGYTGAICFKFTRTKTTWNYAFHVTDCVSFGFELAFVCDIAYDSGGGVGIILTNCAAHGNPDWAIQVGTVAYKVLTGARFDISNCFAYGFYDILLADGANAVLHSVGGNYMGYGNKYRELNGGKIYLSAASKTATTVTDTYNVLADDSTLICNKSSAFTITLPTAELEKRYYIKNIGAGVVTVDAADADTIDGELTQAVYQWSCIDIHCYAANKWAII